MFRNGSCQLSRMNSGCDFFPSEFALPKNLSSGPLLSLGAPAWRVPYFSSSMPGNPAARPGGNLSSKRPIFGAKWITSCLSAFGRPAFHLLLKYPLRGPPCQRVGEEVSKTAWFAKRAGVHAQDSIAILGLTDFDMRAAGSPGQQKGAPNDVPSACPIRAKRIGW